MERDGRYSFIGGTPRAILRAHGRHVEVECAGEVETFEDVDPLDILKSHMAQYTPVKDAGLASPFIGGAVGFLGYDMITEFEPRVPRIGQDDLGAPDGIYGDGWVDYF